MARPVDKPKNPHNPHFPPEPPPPPPPPESRTDVIRIVGAWFKNTIQPDMASDWWSLASITNIVNTPVDADCAGIPVVLDSENVFGPLGGFALWSIAVNDVEVTLSLTGPNGSQDIVIDLALFSYTPPGLVPEVAESVKAEIVNALPTGGQFVIFVTCTSAQPPIPG